MLVWNFKLKKKCWNIRCITKRIIFCSIKFCSAALFFLLSGINKIADKRKVTEEGDCASWSVGIIYFYWNVYIVSNFSYYRNYCSSYVNCFCETFFAVTILNSIINNYSFLHIYFKAFSPHRKVLFYMYSVTQNNNVHVNVIIY